jgi:hypothetical protein
MNDVIILKNGKEIESKVLEVSPSEIKYKKIDNLEGPLFTINKSDVFMIKYQNGSKDVFGDMEEKSNAEDRINNAVNNDMSLQGKVDAVEYYKGYVGAGTGCFFGGLFLGFLLGWIPALICSQTPPEEEKLNYPDPELYKDSIYRHGYTEEAYRIKKNKVWVNYAIGGGIWSAIWIFWKVIQHS